VNSTAVKDTQTIPEQVEVPWGIAFNVAWGSLKRRFLRSIITMLGVILAIAFLTYMMLTNSINRALVELNDSALNVLLQKAGVDIMAAGATDQMMIMLLGLSLLTCLVGIINAMLMAVTERIKEIGTLKCLGALDSFIVKAYFIESSLQGIIGTLLGMLLGVVVTLTISLIYFSRYVFPNLPMLALLQALGIAFLIGSLISISAAILPAYWAARKTPVDAMRVEE
jgi:ABC-type lipoprotein release transport system permease subunit